MKNHILQRLVASALCLASLAAIACSKDQPTPPADTEPNTREETAAPADTTPETLPAEEETTPSAAETEPSETHPGAEPTLSVPMLTPTPAYMSVNAGETAVGLCPERFSPNENGAAFAHLLTDAGATLGENGLPLAVTYRDLSADFEYGADEAYVLAIRTEGVTIEAQTERGAFYGMTTLCSLLEQCDGYIPAITVKDAPRNAQRGVIEGFYGEAYTHEFRKELFAFMGENKMNAYIYAPKDDPKHRNLWRVLYTGSELEIMADLISTARENYVKFIYAISPGGDIRLDSGYETEFRRLTKKCQQLYDLGVRDFAIFLDDISSRDAEGHAKLLNDFQTEFVETHEGVSDLIAITPEYCGTYLTSYTEEVAPLIHQDIVLMWTGSDVIPPSITNESLESIIQAYDRNLLIWWNYPVNDGTLADNLFMGPCEGLDTTLYQSIVGLTSNPMTQDHASMVPLFTTADYLWNPESYEPYASLQAACKRLAPDAHEALFHFVSMSCADYMNGYTDSVELKALLDAYQANPTAEGVETLIAYFDQMIEHADLLARMENQGMYEDMAEWIAKYRAYGIMGRAYFSMEKAYLADEPLNTMLAFLSDYKLAEESIEQNTCTVSSKVLAPYFRSLSPRLNRLCGLEYIAPTVTTTLPVYSSYGPDLACDDDDSTYFWSSRGGQKGDYIQLDLGVVTSVGRVVFNARNIVGETDCIRNGELSYSVDGETWVLLCAINQPVNEIEVDVTARYFRVVVTENQGSWITVSEFSASAEDPVSESLALDEYFIPRYYLLALQDNRIFTALDADDAAAEGHSLLVTVGDSGTVTILSTALPADTRQAVIRSPEGEEIGRVDLQYETVITAPAGSVVSIPLGQGLRIAEIW